MLTKAQKKEQVAKSKEQIQASQALIFADFSGVSIADMARLKKALKEKGASFKVFKKRLLSIAFKDAGVDFDLMQFKAPVGTIFSESELTSVAGSVYKFSKELEKKGIPFRVVGAFDRQEMKAIDEKDFLVIAKLPSRHDLLGMTASVMSGPIRAFMYLIEQVASSKSQGASSEAQAEPVKPEEKTSEAPAKPEAEVAPAPSANASAAGEEKKA